MNSTARKSAVLWSLVILNVLLLLSFVSRLGGGNTAHAQTRRPGEYIMIPGEVTGGSSGVVYIVDTTNGLLTATTYDSSTGKGRLVSMPKIDLAGLFQKGVEQNQPANPRGRR